MSTIQSLPIISSDDGILFTQDENKNIAISVDSAVTTQGNTFNTASKLVKLDENAALPAVDGSNLTGLTTSQIGGLNTNFTDVSLSNIDAIGKAKIATLGMPSHSFIDLTLGTAGSTYTAPADGYFFIYTLATAAGQQVGMHDSTTLMGMEVRIGAPALYASAWHPMIKGQSCSYYYAGTVQYARFIYAQGEV